MAEEKQDITVQIKAIITDLLNPLKEAGAAVQQTAATMNGAFDKVGAAIGAVGKVFGVLTAVLAGGTAFKKVIKETTDWVGAVTELSRRFGLTTQQASEWEVALQRIGMTNDALLPPLAAFERGLATGGEKLKKLGIDTDSVAWKQKDSKAKFLETISVLEQYKQGTDRGSAATLAFGRAGASQIDALIKWKGGLKDAAEETRRLGLYVDGDLAAAVKKQKEGMAEMNLIWKAMQINVGKELLPILGQFGKWMSTDGPSVVQGFSYAIKGLVTVFLALKMAVEMVASFIMEVLMSLWHILAGIGGALYKLVTGDFKGAYQELKQGFNSVVTEFEAGGESMVASWEKMKKSMTELWTEDGKKAAAGADRVGKQGTKTFTGGDSNGDDDKRLTRWKLTLEQMKDAEENWFSWSHQKEMNYWATLLARTDLSEKERLALLKEYNKLRKQVGQDDHAAEETRAKAELDAARNDWDRRLELARQFVARETQIHGAGSKEQAAAMAQLSAIEREVEEERNRLHMVRINGQRDMALQELEWEAEVLAARQEAGEISAAEELEALRQLEAQKLEIKKAAIDEAMRYEAKDEVAREELRQREREAVQQQAIAVQKLEAKAAKDAAEGAASFFSPLKSAWDQALGGMLAGTMSLSQSLRSIWQGMGKMLDKVVMDMVNSWIAAQLKTLAITAATKVKELILHQTTAAATVATTTATAGAQVAAAGAVAGANAAASAAQTPGIGWMIAVPAGLAVLAAVMALKGSIGSAAGGWHTVPQDQMAMIHKDEQVLPANYANGLRNLIENGGPQQAAPPVMPSITVQAMDSQDVARFLRRNYPAVAAGGAEAARNFVRTR